MELYLELKGKVPSKKNRTLFTKTGHVYPDPVIVTWMEISHWEIKSQLNKLEDKSFLPFKEIVKVKIEFETDRRSDLDNMVSSIFDLLQQAEVIENDRLIYELESKKIYSKEFITRVWITRS